jgi:AmmeMemoRadiSam system protein A
MLTEDQKRALVALARQSIVAAVSGGGPVSPQPDLELPGASGAFVTITRHGELRGCLGTLECRAGLAREVVRCAADAATEDPRFPPVAESELPELAVDVSVLGPLEPIDDVQPAAIVVGRHGLVVEQGMRRGLLLPQVAIEWDWTPLQFLRQTCHKAGLPADAWQHGARVFRFEAEVFGDSAAGR